MTASLAARFEAARSHLGALAYHMLDAWLTTVVARICLNTLRSRRARRAEEFIAHVPDPIVDAVGEFDPEHQTLLADAVGLAMFVVLDTLRPP